MARPVKKGLSYFPKDVDFYNDYKIMDLLEKYGPTGVTVYDVILTEIYPAREEPIAGVSSRLIYDRLRPGIERSLCRKEELLPLLAEHSTDVLAVLGAGDLDSMIPQFEALMRRRWQLPDLPS